MGRTVIELTDDEAKLFLLMQKHYQVVAPILGYLDSISIENLANSSIQMDINDKGFVAHTSITKHWRS